MKCGKNLYKEVFADNEEIKYGDFVLSPDKDNIYNGLTLDKINSREELNSAIKEVLSYISELEDYLFAIQISKSLNKFTDPLTVGMDNPWKKFLGDYEVIDKSCEYDGMQERTIEAVGFEVKHYQDFENRFELMEKWSNGYGSIGGLYDGGADLNGGAAVTVSGDENSAIRYAKTGTSWSKRSEKKTYEWIQDSGKVQFIESLILQNRRSDYGVRISSKECVYSLEKI